MSGPDEAGRRQALERVRTFLRHRGAAEADIDEAERRHLLDLLVADRVLLPAERRFDADDIARLTGMPEEVLRRLWRGLGFRDMDPGERAFTELDLEAVRILQSLLDAGLADLDTAVQLARVIGSSMARIAEAELAPTLGAASSARDADDVVDADRLAALADARVPAMGRLLEFVWRRHLQAAVHRAMLQRRRGDPGATPWLAVGFADMVGYTGLSQQLSARELAAVVSRFEQLAHDIVTGGGGRVVKMIGDEVMFVTESPPPAARIALALAEAYADDDLLSDVRAGLAYGPVLVQDGDFFGPVVNLASRAASIAHPGSILVSDALVRALRSDGHDHLVGDGRDAAPRDEVADGHDHLVGDGHDHHVADGHDRLAAPADARPGAETGASAPGGIDFTAIRPRHLKDLGWVQLWNLHRAGSDPSPVERRLGQRWERLSGVLRDLGDLRARGERAVAVARSRSVLGPSAVDEADGGDTTGP